MVVVTLDDEGHDNAIDMVSNTHTSVCKKCIIEHSGIDVCNCRVQRQENERKSAREKWEGKRKHSMPIQKDKRRRQREEGARKK